MINFDVTYYLKCKMEGIFPLSELHFERIEGTIIPTHITCKIYEDQRDYIGLKFGYTLDGSKQKFWCTPILFIDKVYSLYKDYNHFFHVRAHERIFHTIELQPHGYKFIYPALENKFNSIGKIITGGKSNTEKIANLFWKEFQEFHLPKLLEFTNVKNLNNHINKPPSSLREKGLALFLRNVPLEKLIFAWLNGDKQNFEEVYFFLQDFYRHNIDNYKGGVQEDLERKIKHFNVLKELYQKLSNKKRQEIEYLTDFHIRFFTI